VGTVSQLLTADQLAERWQVSKSQVYRLSRERYLPTVHIGRYYRYRIEAVEDWERGGNENPESKDHP
jgi:excisionase family DNA binding protein